jgi:acetyl esterase/lipase
MASATVLSRFPSTLFVTGGRALDMSAAVTSHARLLKLGVDSYLYVMEGAWHAASYGTRGSPEERDVNTYIGRWFGQHLAR